MSASAPSLLRLRGVVQPYAWGSLGLSSAVAQLAAASSGEAVDPRQPYAELWMGTHAAGPAQVVRADGSTQPLRDHLGSDLPFLFKVLSVSKALSIQAHPDAALARKLHAQRGDLYKDPCHKPELACALTPFEALCAFRPLGEIRQHAREYPEFAALLGPELARRLEQAEEQGADEKELLREVFRAMMTPEEQAMKTQLEAMLERLRKHGVQPSVPACEQQQAADAAAAAPSASSPSVCSLPVAPLLLRLASQYPGDVGVFAPLYLNALELRPGQALFLGPNEPHAYLSGDCVECMACSDNVVRAGLTPKVRDTETLLSMLTYASATPQGVLMRRKEVDRHTSEFAPPQEFTEFRLRETRVPKGSSAGVSLPPAAGASIAIVISGRGHASVAGGQKQTIEKGHILLVPSQTEVTVVTEGDEVAIYQCAENRS